MSVCLNLAVGLLHFLLQNSSESAVKMKVLVYILLVVLAISGTVYAGTVLILHLEFFYIHSFSDHESLDG